MNNTTLKVCLISGGTIGGCFAVAVSLTITILSIAKEASPTMPPPEVREQLTRDTLRDINRAVQSRDFADFRSTLSPIWQRQATAQEIGKILEPLVVRKVDFSSAENVPPIFDETPIIDQQGVLTLSGEFPSEPVGARFEFSYFHHRSGWKLVGFHVKQKVQPGVLPVTRELTGICEATLRQFATAVEKDDFSNFHSGLATPFRSDFDAGSLREAFAMFMEKKINLKPEGDLKLVFDEEPNLSAEGILTLQGHYFTLLSKVDFNLDYIVESKEWKLVGLNINANPR